MPKNFVLKTFDRWLAQRASRFQHPPRVVVSRRDSFVLQFAGVTPTIRCVIRKSGTVEIHAIYRGKGWDILTDFDVYERRTPTGQYHCHLCTAAEMFASRAALWVTHSFEPLSAWTNENFQASRWLCLFGDREGSTWAELMPAADVPAARLRNHFVAAYPVVRERRKP